MNFAITGKKITPSQQFKLPADKPLKTKPKPSIPIVNKTAYKKPTAPIRSGQKKDDRKPKIASKEQQKPQKATEKAPLQKAQQKVQTKKLQSPPVLVEDSKSEKLKDQELDQPKQPLKYLIKVRYNHYQDKFQAEDNVLSYRVIEDKYTFADVFKGNYLPVLKRYRNREAIAPILENPSTALDYQWVVEENQEYEVFIQEDEEQESKYERKPYIAPKQEKCPLKKNWRAQELTEEMKKMGIDELGSQKHKEMLEQRALQQMLYS